MEKSTVQKLLSVDAILILLLLTVSLELNVPYALDQLDFHHCMDLFPALRAVLVPGGPDHPLVILGNQFVPLKLMIRTLSVAFAFLYILVGLSRRYRMMRTLLLCGIIGLNVLLPQMLMISARITSGNHALAHDGGVIQMEEAVKLLLRGENPYREDFLGTPLENWRGFKNNVVYHIPYMPGAFLYSVPVYVLWDTVFHWYDQRILYLCLFILSMVLILKSIESFPRRMVALAVFALNPLFARLYILGTNDIVLIALILASAFSLQRNRHTSAFIWLALAASVKQFAWFFIPFFLLYALCVRTFEGQAFREMWKCKNRYLWPGLACFLLTVLPFIFWDPVHFFKDTLLYGSGGLPTSYPIQGFHGFGVGTILLFFRWIPDGSVQFPFIWLQLAFTLPLLGIFLIRQIRDNRLSTAILFASLLLGVFMFFSRYLHGNFLGFILFWPIFAWAISGNSTDSARDN
jgi:Glycosyltransferase family 87